MKKIDVFLFVIYVVKFVTKFCSNPCFFHVQLVETAATYVRSI